RAALARLLGEKYRFSRQRVPRLRAALGLDDDAVQHAYQRLCGEPLETLYTSELSLTDRLRGSLAALGERGDARPPCWFAFAFCVTETVGASVLALPIALALVGPLAGVLLLVVMGIINLLTIVCMAEAAARSGAARYRNAYLGRLVEDFLGSWGSLLFSAGG